MTSLLGCALLGLLLLAGCHDTARNNPLDPELTAPVNLDVRLDATTTGTAALTWTSYAGRQPFAAYQLWRNIARRTEVDTLATILDQGDTTFVDSTLAPNTPYEYRVAVLNSDGFAAASPLRSIPGYSVRPVVLLAADTDAAAGATRLHWSRYRDPRFEAYRIERRLSTETAFNLIDRQTAVDDTTFIDADLKPDQVYFYRIVLEAAAQTWPSNPSLAVHLSIDPVRLLAAFAVPEKGAINLVWTGFAQTGFHSYQIKRQQRDSSLEEILAIRTEAGDTTFTDTTALNGVDYIYTLDLHAFDQVLPSNSLLGRLQLPPVQLTTARPDASTGAVVLHWTRYQGPRFRAYQIRRRSANLAEIPVAVLDDPAATSFRDTGLVGNTEHTYRIAVQTQQDESVVSQEQQAIFHPWIASWPLAIEEDEYVRL
ncbi:MAG: hypothetical protein GKR89_37280 [Candidatus Latescibacteria bacterium]|nr:hypothetical protein [Candidatus Latescibacterota bacterium]